MEYEASMTVVVRLEQQKPLHTCEPQTLHNRSTIACIADNAMDGGCIAGQTGKNLHIKSVERV